MPPVTGELYHSKKKGPNNECIQQEITATRKNCKPFQSTDTPQQPELHSFLVYRTFRSAFHFFVLQTYTTPPSHCVVMVVPHILYEMNEPYWRTFDEGGVSK